MIGSVVAALGLLPLVVPGAPSHAPCQDGTWRLVGYRRHILSAVYNTNVTGRGGAGARMRVSGGDVRWDFDDTGRFRTRGHNNGVLLVERAGYRGDLRYRASWRDGRLRTVRATAAGRAVVTTVMTRPDPVRRREALTWLLKSQQNTLVPTGRVAYRCGHRELRLTRRVRLDSHGGTDVTRWRFSRTEG